MASIFRLVAVVVCLMILPAMPLRSPDIRELERLLAELEDTLDEETPTKRELTPKPLNGVPLNPLETRGLQKPRIKVGSFNIQIFGDTKYKNKEVVNDLVKIILRYDVVLVMEIRDSDGSTLPQFLANINEQATDPYEYTLSERLGRSHIKEQYAFLYKPSLLKVVKTWQYADTADKFERPPFATLFSSTDSSVSPFSLVGIHTKPTAAAEEIDALVDVYASLVNSLLNKNAIIMGDFNGDCSYVSKSKWANIRLRTDTRFEWLISDTDDTTVASSSCAYDRFVAAGTDMQDAIVPGSAKIYDFKTALQLSQDEAEDVSDHFPIELEIYGKVDADIRNDVDASQTVTVHDKQPLEGVVLDSSLTSDLFTIQQLTDSKNKNYLLVKAIGVMNPIKALEHFKQEHDDLISDEVIGVAQVYVNKIFKTRPSLPGLPLDDVPDSYIVTITYNLQKMTYGINIAKRIL